MTASPQAVPTVRRSGDWGPFAVPLTTDSPYVSGGIAWGTGRRYRFGVLPCGYQVSRQEQPQRQPMAFYGVQNSSFSLNVAAGGAPATIVVASGVILSGYGLESIAYSPIVVGQLLVPANSSIDVPTPTWASNQHRMPAITGFVEIWASAAVTIRGKWALVASDPVEPSLDAAFLQFAEPIGATPRDRT